MHKFFLLICSALLPITTYAYQGISSSVGDLRWDQSTVLTGFLKPLTNNPQKLPIKLWNGKTIKLPLWTAKGHSKGLWILVPGTGSNSDGGLTDFLAERAAESGLDTLVLPNPFSVCFQENVSADGIIGFPQRDTDDLIQLVNRAYAAYSAVKGHPAKINVLGLSLGATYALLLEQRESELRFGVSKYIVINPPVQFQYSIDQIDSMIQSELSQNQLGEMEQELSYLFPIFLKAYRESSFIDSTPIGELRKIIGGSEDLHREIIGTNFQQTLRGISKNLIPLPAFSDDAQRISSIQDSITFGWYEGFVGMHIGHDPRIAGRTIDALAHEVDLASIFSASKRLSDTYVIETKDDFLLAPNDLNFLDSRLGDRLYVFSSGGHCGELWYKEFQGLLNRLAQ
jgi:hypothetical protein